MSDLVGKFVLVESIMIGGVVSGRPFLVTSVSGKRVYISEPEQELIDGEWVFNGKFEPCGYKSLKSVKFSFDDFEKCCDAAKKCKEMHWNWWSEMQRNSKAMSVSEIESLGGIKIN